DDDAQPGEDPDLSRQVGQATVPLLGEWLVARRGAANDRRDVAVGEDKAIVSVAGRRLAGEAGSVQRPVEPVPGRVTGEDPPGAVPAVCRGGEAHDEQPGVRIPEAGEWPGPVRLAPEPCGRRRGHRLPPGNEPGAAPAGDNLGVDLIQGFQGVSCRCAPLMCGRFSTADRPLRRVFASKTADSAVLGAIWGPGSPFTARSTHLFSPNWNASPGKARSLSWPARDRDESRKGLRHGVRSNRGAAGAAEVGT
ncbi:MAG: hypothetical protein QOJ93_2340, partial [Actinomycetota bacterium]|nr:hypothetical protein [Actinomycetota bacterium]